MSDGLYELFALAARYFFAALFILIVFRGWRITVTDGRRSRQLRKLVPETGLSGELVVLEGGERAKRGMRYPVIREGTLGLSSASDVRIRHSSVRRKHARFELTEKGLLLASMGDARVKTDDGERVRKLIARDGDTFYIGKVHLMLVLIDAAGREAERDDSEDIFEAREERPTPEAAPREDRPEKTAPARRKPQRPVSREPVSRQSGGDDLFDVGDDFDDF